VLTVAGADCSAGAGLQADLKTFEAMDVYGLTIATVLTAQNSRAISGLHIVPGDFISAQFESLFSDFKIAAIKTGLMISADMVELIASNITKHAPGTPLVIDPVISASTGMTFMDDDALEVLKSRLAPHATLITPNLNEAARLLNTEVARNIEEMEIQARALKTALNTGAALLKGGHLKGADAATDVLYDGRDNHRFRAPFIETKNAHGTGCTLSAAIACGLAKGLSLTDAIADAKQFITNALHGSAHWHIGSGNGPLKHRDS